MAADLFETFAVTIVATMVLGSIYFAGTSYLTEIMMLPLAICAACIVASIIGTYFVRLTPGSRNVMVALYKGLIATGVLSLAALAVVIETVLPNGFGVIDGAMTRLGLAGNEVSGMDLYLCGVAG
jgi:K(+)-stimulated pyrophosphate-energized sodium pump